MLKWLFSTLGFIFLVIFLTGLTSNVFLSKAIDSFDQVETSFQENTDFIVDQSIEEFYANLEPEQKQSFEEIEKLTPAQREIVLSPQCQGEDEGPFCDQRFISGTLTFDEILRDSAKTQVQEQQDVALGQVKDKLLGYTKYPLILISIIAGILSLLFYVVGNGWLGTQTFLGNAAWLSLLSVISYKVFPSLFKKLISFTQPAGANPEALAAMQNILVEWLSPVLNSAFFLSLWLTIISFILWLAIKLFRKYTIETE